MEWINQHFPNMRVADEYTFERYAFPEKVRIWIKTSWTKKENVYHKPSVQLNDTAFYLLFSQGDAPRYENQAYVPREGDQRYEVDHRNKVDHRNMIDQRYEVDHRNMIDQRYEVDHRNMIDQRYDIEQWYDVEQWYDAGQGYEDQDYDQRYESKQGTELRWEEYA